MEMPNHFKSLLLKFFISFLLVLAALHFAFHNLDKPLALMLTHHLSSASDWSRTIPLIPHSNLTTIEIPDFLFLFVFLTSVAAWLGTFFIKTPKKLQLFLYHYACLVPLAYFIKTILKNLFARPGPRWWLTHNFSYSFHWCTASDIYNAFPSGHMLIFTVIGVLIQQYFSKLALSAWVAIAMLAIALICTNYHFLSDVLCGGFCGYWLAVFGVLLLNKVSFPSRLPTLRVF
ncbi:MAG: phosphoesterase, PA-phosphatase related protein [Gammaproteobacteria bacterium]|jgi:hypothetical protein|nr:phosphoesterase, PA-phosphatase related protein [Gammaproteobacteria bacterium]